MYGTCAESSDTVMRYVQLDDDAPVDAEVVSDVRLYAATIMRVKRDGGKLLVC